MKHQLFTLFGAAALMAACAPQLPEGHYRLDGTLAGADGQYIRLAYMAGDSTIVDSALVSGGAFTFEGKLDIPFRYVSLCLGDPDDFRNPRRCGFYLEPAAQTIAIEADCFGKPVVTGSLTQSLADSLQTMAETLMAEMQPLRDSLAAATDEAVRDDLTAQLEACGNRIQEAQLDFLRTHPDFYAAPLYLQALMGQMSYEKIQAAYNNISDEVKRHNDMTEIEEELAALARIRPGMPAPDFTALSVTGDSIRFSETVKGKYVLLDFWASWCVPCRKSFPHVKALYEKYRAKGLEVFCVADNDSSPDEWREAIGKDGVGMFHHVLRGMKIIDRKTYRMDKTHDVSSLYAVHFLPTKFLIDNEGRIVGKFNDEELDAKLKELLGE